MTNMGEWAAAWRSDNYEYYISAMSETEIYRMIESIYKEEPK